MKISERFFGLVMILALCLPVPSMAEDLAQVDLGAAAVRWDLQGGDFEKAVLTVSMPDGNVVRREFKAGELIVFELGASMKDGAYAYELRGVPRIDAAIRRELAAARRTGNEAAVIERLRAAGKLPRENAVQSGSFLVEAGAIVPRDIEERPETAAGTGGGPQIITGADQVIPDDLIVQQSLCVGFDCVNNESFGFDTIRLKENNTRIKFEDTSTGTFPTNDWQLTANDSASGGSSKFSIEDITGSKVPFTITAGASTNSIFVDSTGRVGLRSSTPVLDLHINTSNTPAIRLEQNNSGGFTAQTWDIGANEANFFVRDVTGGSKLSFRIRPGAPTSSIDINSDGEVGIGTASPTQELTVKSDTGNENIIEVQRSAADNQTLMRLFETTDGSPIFSLFDLAANEDFRLAATGGHSWLSGTVGINCNAPGGFDFAVKTGTGASTACNTGTFSGVVAGSTTFSVTSSRSIKENLEPVRVPGILEKIGAIDVYKYDFIQGPKDRLGLMAEDFHQVFRRGSDKMLDGQEVEMALWLAVKELTAQNKELTQRLADLEARLAAESGNTP